jgi:hypothetical protein
MELSETTLEHLQDEAYAYLCRQAVEEKLASLEREKAEIASTRPPFGVLARKETRDAFAHSMRTALDNEAALRDRLAQLTGIEAWLRPVLRKDVAAYLADASPDYGRLQQIRARFEDWECAFQELPELLIAFARELRGLRQASGSEPAAGRLGQGLPALREIAVRLERKYHELLVITGAVTELTQAGSLTDLRAPALPDFRRVDWVSRLAVLPAGQTIAEVTRVEKEIRDFLAGGSEVALARLEAGRDVCGQFENTIIEQYWAQLRAHARAHYVEERDIDDVLAMLVHRYVSADIARQQQALSTNPFLTER